MSIKAVIIAGGFGKRLKPITDNIPKSMVKLRGRPILQHIIEKLKASGVEDIIICTGYLSEIIERYFRNGSGFGVNIIYSKEQMELGTGGALKNAEALIGKGRFLVLYGDLVVDMDFKRLMDFHTRRSSECTLTLHKTDHPYDSDMIETDINGRIIAFLGKAKPGENIKGWGNAGVYCLEHSILKYFPNGKSALDKEVLPEALKKGAKLYGYITNETIRDIGTHERYERYR